MQGFDSPWSGGTSYESDSYTPKLQEGRSFLTEQTVRGGCRKVAPAGYAGFDSLGIGTLPLFPWWESGW